MKFKNIRVMMLLPMLALACKSREASNAQSDVLDSSMESTNKSMALDVNDVSILFNLEGNGSFYPNIPVTDVWKSSAFDSMIQFAKGNENNGVEFGRFDLPQNYMDIVEKYRKDPTLVPSPDLDPVRLGLQKAMKDIAAEITNKGTQCEFHDGTQRWRCIDRKARPNFNGHRAAIASLPNWRIVSMRMDLCAGARPDEPSKQCDVEFRLIAQPYGDYAPNPASAGSTVDVAPVPGTTNNFMFDVSAHLLYKVGELDLTPGSTFGDITDFNGNKVTTAMEIIQDLQKIKASSPVITNGKPLGIHPGLRKDKTMDGQPLAMAIKKFVTKYTKGGSAMTGVTSMQLTSPAVFGNNTWVFFQGIIQGGRWLTTPITGSRNLAWSIRSRSAQGAVGKMYPPPENTSVNPLFEYEKGQVLPANVAALPSFVDNPGRYGDPKLKVGKRTAASVRNTDCISCHMTATRSFEWGIKSMDMGMIQPDLYVPPVGTTAYLSPEVIPRLDYSLRNFGWFLPAPLANPLPPPAGASVTVNGRETRAPEPGLAIFNFPGTRTESGSVMTRVVTESAELVNMINSRFLNLPNPGLVCPNENPTDALKAGANAATFLTDEAQRVIRRDKAVHAQISDCLLFSAYRNPSPKAAFNACAMDCRPAMGN